MYRLVPVAISLLPTILFAAEQPNVIFFIADDVSWNDYGCYGSQTARTPNIDALAANGRRFGNAYLTASSCSPSRCSVITGRFPHNNGGASELHRPLSWHLVKFPSLLRKAGYYTAISGKDHMPQDDPPEGKLAPEKTWDHKDNGKNKENSGGHANWVKVTKERPRDKPFFFWFAAYDAHRGWDGDRQWKKQFGRKHQQSTVIPPPFLVDDEVTRDDLASYHNEVTRFDHFIGLTVAELKRQGVLDNTLIFVFADNGRPFPRAKTRLHDSGMKTALVAHWPVGIKGVGQPTQSMASIIDLAPTVLTATGVDVPNSMQGVSLLPLFDNPNACVRRYVFSEHNWHDYEAYGRSVRGNGFLYLINKRPHLPWQGPADSVRSASHITLLKKKKQGELTAAQQDVFLVPRPAIELYHVHNDPHQLNNLAGSAQYTSVEKKLSDVLQQWQQETGDTVPEKLTPDTFDRMSGDSLKIGTPRGTAPGSANNADHINRSGPS
ncbi:sulfatase [Planctomycetaceae bacterium]|nr:sulfatase [Planctomycetaceae bacterium]